MCGIVGYIGNRSAYERLIQGLYRLEYRGYDSAGVAIVKADGSMNVCKAKGKVKNLEDKAAAADVAGCVGIAHTRWATHGEPNDVNAHPHVSQSGRIALVHNGTIENYAVLKKALVQHGKEFRSETDTEVLVQLIEYVKESNGCNLYEAVKEALLQVEGAYAIAVVDRDDPDTLIAARKASPLVIGIGEGETFIASDATPIVGYTDKVVYMNDNEVALIRQGGKVDIESLLSGKPSKLNIKKLRMSVEQLEKGGYDTFMLKEIFEQPETLKDCIRGRITADSRKIVLSGVLENKERFVNANRIVIVACGTSWHAALIGKRVIQEMCALPVEVEYASEFRYGYPYITDRDVVIAISQSGETADTLMAARKMKAAGAKVLAVTNVLGSTAAREADATIYLQAGPEVSVASTKAYTAQLVAMALVALFLAQARGNLTGRDFGERAAALRAIPGQLRAMLDRKHQANVCAGAFENAASALFLGRGFNAASAEEGALKLKEVSYLHAEAYAAGEMKHGPIALLEPGFPVLVVVPDDSVRAKTVSNIAEIKARGATVCAVATEGDDEVAALADRMMWVPPAPEWAYPVSVAVALQQLAREVALARGCDIDKPRNLAKSVTTE